MYTKKPCHVLCSADSEFCEWWQSSFLSMAYKKITTGWLSEILFLPTRGYVSFSDFYARLEVRLDFVNQLLIFSVAEVHLAWVHLERATIIWTVLILGRKVEVKVRKLV